MNDGVVVDVSSLIALQRFAQKAQFLPNNQAMHIGNHTSKHRGRGMDFAEVRHYQAGDEIRHMEWRVTARTGKPHIKIYQEERERPTVLLVDFNPSMYFGTRHAFKSVIAARLAALISWTAIAQGDKIGGIVYSQQEKQEFSPKGRRSGVLPLLRTLSQFTQDYKRQLQARNTDSCIMSDVLVPLRRVTRPGSIIVLISDFYNLDKDSEKHLSRLRQHNDILVYHICDMLELMPPQPGQYAITNGDQALLLDTSQREVSEAYEAACSKRLDTLKTLCHRLKIQYIPVSGAQDLALLVRRSYPRRSNG